MMQSALRGDALRSAGDGFELRIGLPWIRSLPVSSIRDVSVIVDDEPVPGVVVALGGDQLEPPALRKHPGWWFLQDRLVLAGARTLRSGTHTVSVDLRLLVPYLQAGPGIPLILPFHLEAELVLDAAAPPTVARDVA